MKLLSENSKNCERVMGRRHVALQVMYLGYEHGGFARQDMGDNTVEARLLAALHKTRLIDPNITSLIKSGRTDKGVSAFMNAISVNLKSKFGSTNEVITDESSESEEMDYVRMLNAVLPLSIRILAWKTVPLAFSARFNTLRRTYRYYLPRTHWNGLPLDLSAISDGLRFLEGEHDFRNICKMDVVNVKSFRRTIYQASVLDAPYGLFCIEIIGSAFLWHQIRFVVALLILIGLKKESPDVIAHLLDIEQNPGKPNYEMALDFPLVLYACDYAEFSFKPSRECLKRSIQALNFLHFEFSCKAAMLKDMLTAIDPEHEHETRPEKNYVPLLKRPRQMTYEERVESLPPRKRAKRNEKWAHYDTMRAAEKKE